MRSQSLVPPCKQRPRGRLLLVGGFTVPVIVLGSVLGSAPAFAANVSGKGALQTAFSNAGSATNYGPTVTLQRDLTADAGDDDRLVLGAVNDPRGLLLDLNGHALAIDRLEVAAGSDLTVTDSSSAGTGRLLVGQAQSAPADTGTNGTGILLGDQAVFTDESAVITTTGTEGNPGLGGDGSTVYIKGTVGHSTVTATGAAGAAGINASQVTVTEGSQVTATGGTGAAGIGGGTGADGGALDISGTARVSATAGSGSDVSAVGFGSGGTAAGGTTIGATARLTTHGALRIPAGTTVTNSGELVLDGTASGAGALQNDGRITGTTEGVATGLSVTGHNYKVTLDADGGTTSNVPGFVRLYGPSLGTAVDGFSASKPDQKFLGWNEQDSGAGIGNTQTGASTQAGSSVLPAGSTDGTAVVVALKAVFRHKITSTAPAAVRLRNGEPVPTNAYIHGDDISAYAVDASTPLPAGITFANGVFSGTPTANVASDVLVHVTGPYDAAPVPLTFHLVVSPIPAVTSTSTSVAEASTDLLPITSGVAYSDHLRATGAGTLTYTKVSGALPAGLTFTNGVIAGTTTAAAGEYPIDVKVTSDQYGDSATTTVVLHVGEKPALTTADADLGKATTGEAYGTARGHLSASGTADLGPVTFTKTSGALPAGLTVASNGTFSGVVDAEAAPGTFTFGVTAHSRYGDSAETTYHLVVGKAPVITTVTPAPLTIGKPYTGSAAIALADSGTGTAVYSAPAGDLPPGLSLSGSGVLSGTITAPVSGPTAHSYTFLVTAVNDFGTRTRSYTVRTGQAPSITTATLPKASVGGLYEKSVAVAGDGTAAYSLSGTGSATVPNGLSIDSATGLLSGSIGDRGTYALTVTVVTEFGTTTRDYSLVADLGAGLIMHALAPVTVGTAYSTTVANGGTSVTYAIDGGVLPSGLTLGADGSITGTLTSAQSIDFTVKATNSYGTTRNRYQFEAGTAPVIVAPTTADGTGVLTHALTSPQTVTATGVGSTTATWAKVSGALPAGIALDASTGVLSGTFAAVGEYTFGLKATTAFGTSAVQSYTVVVGAAPVVGTTSLPDGTAGTAYDVPVLVTGDGAKTVTVTGLPAGLSYTGGSIVGTPTAAGTSNVVVTVTSRFGSPAATTVPFVVAPAAVVTPAPVVTTPAPVATTPAPAPVVTTPAPVVTTQAPAPVASTPAPAPAATTPAPAPVVAAPVLADAPKAAALLGHPFTLSVAASSTVAVTYSVKGALPKGLKLDTAKGAVTGTPTQDGVFTFTITAKSSAGTDTQAYTVVVPEQQELVTARTSRVNPLMGTAFDVTVGSLQKGERWRVTVGKKVLAHGVAAKAGSVTASVTLPRTRADKTYTVHVAGSRTVTDPAKTASADIVVTAATPKRALSLKRSAGTVTVTRLAPKERVTITVDGAAAVSGRADAEGVFVFTPKGLKAGKHAVVATGNAADRTGALTLKVVR